METEILNEQAIPKLSNPRENQKKYLFLMASVFVFFVLGIVLFNLGVFKREEPEESENQLSAMTPPKAKSKEIIEEKYGSNFSKSMNEKSSEDMENLSAFTDKEIQYSNRSNENLSEEDYQSVVSTTNSNPQYSPKLQRTTKQKLDNKFQLANQRQQRLNNYYAREDTPLFKKTKEDLREEQLALEEKELNQKTADLVLNNLEKLNNPFKTQENIVPSKIEPKPQNDISSGSKKIPETNSLGQLSPEIAPNTIGNKFKKTGFYSETSSIKRTSFSENESIPAVVHGDAEGSVVTNGSTIKVRLLENTVFRIENQKIILNKGSLITGNVAVNGDRLMISISSIRLGNSIYPVSIQAFDLDGSMGLNIPNASGKALLDRTLTNAASRPLTGTQIFVPSGGVVRQVGTQLALQGTQSLLQGVQNLARSKRASPKVTVRPNYKILLKTVNLQNLENTDSIDDL
jgi:conjugative transposon TraM protein